MELETLNPVLIWTKNTLDALCLPGMCGVPLPQCTLRVAGVLRTKYRAESLRTGYLVPVVSSWSFPFPLTMAEPEM